MAISKETEEKETFKRIVIHFYNDNCGLPKRIVSANSTDELIKLLEELKKLK